MDTKATQPTPARTLVCDSGPRAVRAPALTIGTAGPGGLEMVATFWGLVKGEARDRDVTETRVLYM